MSFGRLAQALMQHCEAALRPHLQTFLAAVIQGKATQSELRHDWDTLIHQVSPALHYKVNLAAGMHLDGRPATLSCAALQVHRCCPQALLPVLPSLEGELKLDDVSRRVAAVKLLGRLFSQRQLDLDTTYSQLFAEFLRRFRDVKVRTLVGFIDDCTCVHRLCNFHAAREMPCMHTQTEVRFAAVQLVSSLLQGCSSSATRSQARLKTMLPCASARL